MTTFEITIQIGEFLFTEVEEVNNIEYIQGDEQPSSFTIIMETANVSVWKSGKSTETSAKNNPLIPLKMIAQVRMDIT